MKTQLLMGRRRFEMKDCGRFQGVTVCNAMQCSASNLSRYSTQLELEGSTVGTTSHANKRVTVYSGTLTQELLPNAEMPFPL
jgi:hypothetical protein